MSFRTMSKRGSERCMQTMSSMLLMDLTTLSSCFPPVVFFRPPSSGRFSYKARTRRNSSVTQSEATSSKRTVEEVGDWTYRQTLRYCLSSVRAPPLYSEQESGQSQCQRASGTRDQYLLPPPRVRHWTATNPTDVSTSPRSLYVARRRR
jgi:hypothetical protein